MSTVAQKLPYNYPSFWTSNVVPQLQYITGHLDIYLEMGEEHFSKPHLMLNRNDFMFHTEEPTREDAYRDGQFKLVGHKFNFVSKCWCFVL